MNRRTLWLVARCSPPIILLLGCSASPAGTTNRDGGSGRGPSDSGLGQIDGEIVGEMDSGNAGQIDSGTVSRVDGGSGACAAVATLRATTTSTGSITLVWAGGPGTTATVSRKTYCGSDAYVALATLPAGVATYTDTSVSPDWVYWYEVTVTDAGGGTASGAVGTQAAAGGALGCSNGAPPSPSGVSPCETTADASTPPETGVGQTDAGPVETGVGGCTVPIVDVSPGAQIVTPNDDIPAIVTACSMGVVHFSAGTYTLTSQINVPANCTLEGELGWTSIITGGVSGNPLFELGGSSNVTITRLNFQHLAGGAIQGSGSGGNIVGTHIYLNLFEYIGAAAIAFWDPANILIERNAFNYIAGDGVHLFSTPTPGTYLPEYPQANVILRWNFGANQAWMWATVVQFSFLEIQLGSPGLHIFQNVLYSTAPNQYNGSALSIASGEEPCTTSACVAPENGTSAVFIDGNILLDNGLPSTLGQGWGGIETMGVEPVVQNNYQRGWGSFVYTGWIFAYDAASNSYSVPASAPLYVQDNTACGITGVSSASQLVSSEIAAQTSDNLGTGNTYSSSCANLAPPALPPEMVAPPDLLDANGGMNALTSSPNAGANTYWPNINANLNSLCQ